MTPEAPAPGTAVAGGGTAGGAAQPGTLWRLHEVRTGDWWAVDERNGTAYALDERTAVALWQHHELLVTPLPAAMRAAVTAPAGQRFTDLRFVGTTVRYRSADAGVLAALEASFAGACSSLRNSPAVVVDLAGGVDVERLHRSIPGARAGVTVRSVHRPRAEQGSSALPVLPPVQAEPFAGRFAGLHAAMLAMPGGVVAVCGRQRAGKTSTATSARRHHAAAVLTDELVLVEASGAAWGVALPVRERTGGQRVSYPLEAGADGAHLVGVDHVVVLDGAGGEPSWTPVGDTSRAVQLLAPHLRPLDGSLGRATSSMLALLRRGRVWHWRLRAWPQLAEDIAAGLTRLSREETP